MMRCEEGCSLGRGGGQSQGEVQGRGAVLGSRRWERPQGSHGFRFKSSSLQPHHHKLSDQREALSRGQNPLPIYCALNTKRQNLTTFEFGGE